MTTCYGSQERAQGGYLTKEDEHYGQWPDMTTLSAMKSYLGIDPADTTYDTKLSYWITYYSQAVQGYLYRYIPSTQVTMTFYRSPCAWQSFSFCGPFQLTHYPVITLDDITIDSVAESDLTVYEVDKPLARVYPPSAWGATNDIVITYTAGYATVPADLLHVVIGSVEQAYLSGFQDTTTGQQGSIKSQRLDGVVSVSYYNAPATSGGSTGSSGSLDFAKYYSILDRYRNNKAVL